ncbi:MAG: single-stranded DNA-binding protein [Bernardetiaceae bacterium]
MALGINKVILVGNLGRDPEVRTLESGAKLATFSIATTETYKDKDGNKKELTEWHNIVAWRGLADVIERYVRKGSKIYVEGKLTTRSYEQDGITKYITEVLAREILLLDSRTSTGSPNVPPPMQEPPMPTRSTNTTAPETTSSHDQSLAPSDTGTDEDDLPF